MRSLVPNRMPRGGRAAGGGAAAFVALLIAACLTLPAGAARGEWYDHYLDAIEAIDEGRPRDAIALIERALALKPSGGYFRTYGNNYIRYAPYSRLGIAHHDAGSCEAALAAFERAGRDGEADEEPALASRVASLTAACRALLAPPESASRETPPASDPSPAPDPVDRDLVERGARAYVAGDFGAAIRAFDQLVRQAPRSATARLLHAAALHGHAVSTRGDASLDRCRAELAAARRLDPALEPDPRYFSPRLIALFRDAR